ncbi:MAG: hypothetical protein WKG52_01080 [Variovorax sp.]
MNHSAVKDLKRIGSLRNACFQTFAMFHAALQEDDLSKPAWTVGELQNGGDSFEATFAAQRLLCVCDATYSTEKGVLRFYRPGPPGVKELEECGSVAFDPRVRMAELEMPTAYGGKSSAFLNDRDGAQEVLATFFLRALGKTEG